MPFSSPPYLPNNRITINNRHILSIRLDGQWLRIRSTIELILALMLDTPWLDLDVNDTTIDFLFEEVRVPGQFAILDLDIDMIK